MRRKVEGGMRKMGVLIGTWRLLFLPQSLLSCTTSSDCSVCDLISSGEEGRPGMPERVGGCEGVDVRRCECECESEVVNTFDEGVDV